ncbi:hypothetical protein AMECASPLE_039603 [Ameca splendens]|uniref:Immunoglobulin V-set domain-containing protein n=1 Tax=Ameca splendens TaxID=208324 RepID=A0ABV0XXJ4_9TELE
MKFKSLFLCCGQTPDAVLTIEPNWSTFYSGESVTFICDMNEGEETDWSYQINRNGGAQINQSAVKLSLLLFQINPELH